MGGWVGLVGALVLTVLGPPVWVKVLGYPAPIFPLDPPTLITLPLAFATCAIVSVLDRGTQGAADRAGYAGQRARMASQTPTGADRPSGAIRA